MRFVWVCAAGGALMIAAFGVMLFTTTTGARLRDSGRLVKRYYIPSESMEPTLEPGDQIMPRAIADGGPRRGMVVVFRLGNDSWVQRVAALPGDTIQLRGGVVILNGNPVTQTPSGRYNLPPPRVGYGRDIGDPGFRKLALEQFPGEPRPHRIIDEGDRTADSTEAFTVPAGHVFLLGDNRDNSADSRFPRTQDELMTVPGVVPMTDIVGEVDFILRSERFGWSQPIDDWTSPAK